jgi:hypothetical protein
MTERHSASLVTGLPLQKANRANAATAGIGVFADGEVKVQAVRRSSRSKFCR